MYLPALCSTNSRPRGAWSIGLALLASGLAAPALAQQSLPPDSTIQRMIDARVKAGWTPGIVLGVLRADGTRQVFTAGTSGTPRPLDGATIFEIGSITKVFTGILLADMAETGDIRLDQPVAELLPTGTRVPERNGRAITLVDLATQTSGLPRLPGNLPAADPENPYADYTDSLLFAFLAGYTLPRDIGSQYEYSNLGVGLLGNALARRTGQPYEELVRTRVLQPLNMPDTRVTLTAGLTARAAQGHTAEGRPAGMWDLPSLAGAGALRSSAEEMLTFLAANLNGVPGSLGRAMETARVPRNPAGSPVLKIGLGWHILEKDGRSIVWHNGGTGGFRSFTGLDPARKTGVVILSNSANDSDDLGFHLLDPANPVDTMKLVRPVAVPESVLMEYIGKYELAPTFSIAITLEDGRLLGQGTGQPRFEMYALNPQEFFLRVVPARIVFQRDAGGKVTGLVLFQGGQELAGRRVP